jgi:predicted dehydrogenase/threonine dehydrogenase-like Zn-dependent dehydrogenase
MRQIAQYQDGRLELQEVPRPTPPPGGLLVRLTHSVISAGTERTKVRQAGMNLLQKARARPDQVKQVLETGRTLGWSAALEKVRNRLRTPTPLGYSAAGIVEALSGENTRFREGQRVAVAGAECAFHAEFVAVPDLLAAPVPAGVENWEAAYTALASIALHAVRQLEPRLGERVLVIGQGLIGLLVTAMLRAGGVRVGAVDLVPSRRSLAEAMGAERVLIPGEQSLTDEVHAWTGGYGVDGVVLCAATQSNIPIEQSAEVLRDRGRIVIVGNTRADLDWRTFYERELEVRYSRSYGPGRYDTRYEWGGADYPIGYVRWTEQRNFEACLHLMKIGGLNLSPLTTRRVPFAAALQAYHELLSDRAQDVGVVLEYSTDPAEVSPPMEGLQATPNLRPGRSPSRTSTVPVTRLDVIGAGNFARTMLLPHLAGRIPLGTVVNATALSANHARVTFGFAAAATEPAAALADSPGEAVLIATRHHLHAPFVTAALQANRHVFVEKPLCLTREELAGIDAAFIASHGSVQVGFNRRFAGASAELRRLIAGAPGPKIASIRVAAGRLSPNHWFADYAQSGGRVLGEASHFLDYFCFLFGTRPVRVAAQSAWPVDGRLAFPDSVTAQVEFADGSCGQLVYTGEADPSWPKEQCTVFGAGFVAEITNFQELVIHRGRRTTTRRFRGKGHAEEMAAWLAYLRGETEHPLPYHEARQSMVLAFAVLEAIQRGRSVELDPQPTGVTAE